MGFRGSRVQLRAAFGLERTPFLKSAGSNLLQLRLFLTLKERATPIVRSRPSSVHMDSVWFKRTLWETRNTVLKNHAEAQFIIAGRREPSERSASYQLMQLIDHVVMTICKSSINPRRLQYR